ncbi:MAG TPA: substrate-binding domain-containing protein [Methylomirabilota bacterium]|jgi:excisionase family DNA binding protein|nr:substrate-binding domain-containing protein [Methylomirabilota bacterium]
MEPRFLTVAEAARYLRLNPRSVYLLAQRGAMPASRATGKWLFPVHLLDEWLEASARQRGGERPARGRAALPAGTLFLAGSDDPALDLLVDALHGDAGSPLLFTATLGSVGGLEALARSRADVACAHLADPASGEYNVPQVPRYVPECPAVVVNLFHRELGLVVWTGNPRKLGVVGDLGRRGLRFVNRQAGSGTRIFTDGALAAAGVAPKSLVGYREEVSTHWGVALRVLRGEADVGVATRAVAAALSLGFVGLTRERFDLVIPKASFFQPPVQTFVEAIRSERFRRGLERLGGYDWAQTGRVVGEVA